MLTWRMKRAKRVRMHLIEPGLPSVEGLLVAKRRRDREYVIALPQLIVAAEGNPTELDAPLAVIPYDRVAFYEEVR